MASDRAIKNNFCFQGKGFRQNVCILSCRFQVLFIRAKVEAEPGGHGRVVVFVLVICFLVIWICLKHRDFVLRISCFHLRGIRSRFIPPNLLDSHKREGGAGCLMGSRRQIFNLFFGKPGSFRNDI